MDRDDSACQPVSRFSDFVLHLGRYQGIPCIGFLVHFIRQKDYIRKLVDMGETYGPICTVRMGSFECVWLNDYNVIREAWSRHEFSGRPLVPGILERTNGFRGGIIFNDGPSFTEEQGFVVKTLRYLGLGKNSMESCIVAEAEEICGIVTAKLGQPISLRHAFNLAALNVVWGLATGERYHHDDPDLLRLTAILDKNMELNDGAKAAFFLPWLATLFPSLSGFKGYIEQAREIFYFWEKVAKDRIELYSRKDHNEMGESGCFVDAYIQNMRAVRASRSNFDEATGVKALAATLQDLFIAGTETTATTLSWFFLYMASFPSVQKAVVHEIQENLGTGDMKRLPSLSDRRRLPLLEAAIMETMRFGTLAPLGMVHRTVENTAFQGYHIPANTIVMSNIAAVHMNKELWGDPENFRPQRFLSSCGTKTVNFKYFLPFSHGRRKCVGEALARNELFLFSTMILQQFSVQLEKPLMSLEPVVGVSAVPPEHKLIFIPHDC